MSSVLDRLYFSQSAISTYVGCQLRFRRRYLEELYWPRPVSDAVKLGNEFHALSRRYYLTGKIDEYEGQVGVWIKNLQQFRPYDPSFKFYPEQQLRLNGEIRLVAKYDLVVMADKVYIYDWKTDSKIKKTFYRNSMQTVVYRYLMAAAGFQYWGRTIKPADIVMCYWNPAYPNEPLYLPYTEKQYRRDEKNLKDTIKEIMQKPWDEFFSTSNKALCSRCEYSSTCHGKPGVEEEFDPDDLSLSWEDVDDLIL